MDLAPFAPLYRDGAGRCASVYLTTTRTEPPSERPVALRWRALRERLAELGADEATLSALDAAAGSDRGEPGPQGQALFASGGEIRYGEELPAPPDPDSADFDRLPRLLPLLTRRSDLPRCLLVRVDHTGAELDTAGLQDEEEVESVGETSYPLHKVHSGGWSQKRHQRRAENTWDRNARGVAEEAARLAERERAELLVLAGDVRARALFLDHLQRVGGGWRERTVELPGRPGGSAAEAEARAEREERRYREDLSGGAGPSNGTDLSDREGLTSGQGLSEEQGSAQRQGSAQGQEPSEGQAGGAPAEPGSVLGAAEKARDDARKELADRFAARLADGTAVEGLAATTEALRSAQVDTLLLDPDPDGGLMRAELWWGTAPDGSAEVGRLGFAADELTEATRSGEVFRDRAADVLVREATLGSAALVLTGRDRPGPHPAEGVGALLRRAA